MIKGVYIRDVVRIFCIFSFLSILDTLSLVHWPCEHLVIAYLILMLIYILRLLLLSFTYLYMLFLFSLYAPASYIMYAILHFCFTLRCLDEFCLKYYRNTGCQSLYYHRFSFCKVFQEFVLG